MKYQAVIFDLFGTLVPEPSRWKQQSVLQEMAAVLSVPADDFVRLWAETRDKRSLGIFSSLEANTEHICRMMGAKVKAYRTRLAYQLKVEATRLPLKPREGAEELLSHLKSADYRIGLISNCGPEVPPLWQETPLAPLVDIAVFSAAAGLKKPDPRIYRSAAEQLAVKPEGCLYVGDGDSSELTGAANAGMHPVLISVLLEDASDDPRENAEEWKGPAIKSLKEVLALVE